MKASAEKEHAGLDYNQKIVMQVVGYLEQKVQLIICCVAVHPCKCKYL